MRKKDYGTGIPDYAIESLAKVLLPELKKFYENEENRKAFNKWKEEQEQLKRRKKAR
jgi:hypothetical protein